MEWTNLQLLRPRIKIMKPYLPRSIFSQLERITGRSGPSREQLRKISSLGKSVGLEKHEIIAAIDAPIAAMYFKAGKSQNALNTILYNEIKG